MNSNLMKPVLQEYKENLNQTAKVSRSKIKTITEKSPDIESLNRKQI